MKTLALFALATIAFLFSPIPLEAQEKGGKGNPSAQMVKQFMKQLEKAELSEEQTSKIKELFGKVAKEVSAKRTEGGITAEMLKKRAEASKSARDAGKKAKEAKQEVDAAVALTDAQKTLMTDTEAMLSKVRIEIGKLLKPEQIAKLPEQLQGNFKEKDGSKKKKARS
jgi:septation ring formation regulator EzrA